MRKINHKHWLVVACIIIFIGFLIFSTQRACDIYDENSILKGQAIELVKLLDSQKKLLIKSKENNTKLQDEMDEIIATSEEAISEVAEINNALNRNMNQLHEAKVKLTDSESIILNLEEQVETQSKIIINLEFTLVKKDEQIFALTKKYISERNLRIDTEKAFEQCNKVIQINNLRIKGLEKKLKSTRFMSNVKSGAMIGLISLVIYGLVK